MKIREWMRETVAGQKGFSSIKGWWTEPKCHSDRFEKVRSHLPAVWNPWFKAFFYRIMNKSGSRLLDERMVLPPASCMPGIQSRCSLSTAVRRPDDHLQFRAQHLQPVRSVCRWSPSQIQVSCNLVDCTCNRWVLDGQPGWCFLRSQFGQWAAGGQRYGEHLHQTSGDSPVEPGVWTHLLPN